MQCFSQLHMQSRGPIAAIAIGRKGQDALHACKKLLIAVRACSFQLSANAAC